MTCKERKRDRDVVWVFFKKWGDSPLDAKILARTNHFRHADLRKVCFMFQFFGRIEIAYNTKLHK